MASENPRKWRYTWEAQSHIPILKLFLFAPEINPIIHCKHLDVDLKFEKSLIKLSWIYQQFSTPVSLFVPLPRVLVDLESPLNFRALDNHIEVKISLLLPVDHPIVSAFISELNFGDEFGSCTSSNGFLDPLSMESDFKTLSSKGEVHFYCRKCAFKLTKRPVRCLVDLPSVNWTDVADNWFGACCCSFGGISEKLVTKYVKSYRCAEGTFLLTTASVLLCKEDVAGYKSLEVDPIRIDDDKGFLDTTCNADDDVGTNACCSQSPIPHDCSTKLGLTKFQTENPSVSGEYAESDDHRGRPCSTPLEHGFANDAASENHCCAHDSPESSLLDQAITNRPVGLEADQKSFLNCYLGNAFLFRSSGISKDIEWIDFACPQCSCVLGAYPCSDDSEPLDGGIRLLKCYISISPPTDFSNDLFSKYTLERMFTFQLLESAKDELSFRTVVKDLKMKSSMLHIVLLNPDSWCCSGFCSEDTAEPVKIYLHPVVKVLFSRCCDNTESELRLNQEWETKNQVDEIYMLTHVIRELMKSVDRAKETFPLSFSSSQGFSLSSILR